MNNLISSFTDRLKENYKPEMDQFSDPSKINKYYLWKDVIKDIDRWLGRNHIQLVLRSYGILEVDNVPILNNPKFPYFQCKTNNSPNSPNAHYYDNNVFFIQGKGILEIRGLIRAIRLSGGKI